MPLLNHLLAKTRGSAAEADEAVAGVTPVYQVRATDEAYGLVAYLPGVAKDGLELTVGPGELRLVGRRGWKQPDGWTLLHRETPDAPFELNLEHDNAIDAEKIHAELKDGVLRVSLPKAEALKPRKISVG